MSANPCCPIIRQCSASSSAIESAVRSARATFSSAVFPAAIFRNCRSIAQERFTAVGLVALSWAAAPAMCSSNESFPVASSAARYMPYPAHVHLANCRGHLLDSANLFDHKLVRQKSLIDQLHGAFIVRFATGRIRRGG